MKKLISFLAAAAIAVSSFTAMPVFAEEVSTKIYYNNFNAGDESGDQSAVTDISPDTSTYFYKQDNSTLCKSDKVYLRRQKGKNPTAKISFENTAAVTNITDNNYKITATYDAHIMDAATISTSSTTKKVTIDYLLSSADATYDTALSSGLGGLRFFTTGRKSTTTSGTVESVDDWQMLFIDNTGKTTLLTTMPDATFAADMQDIKIEYVLRENAINKNVARVYINDTQCGGDVSIGNAPTKAVGSMIIKYSNTDTSAVKARMDVLDIRTTTNDEIGEEPEEPEVPEEPATEKYGYLINENFENDSYDRWVTKGAGNNLFQIASDSAYNTGKIFKMTGKESEQVEAHAYFTPTYLLNNSSDPAMDAKVEGINARNVTEFDVKTENLNATGQSIKFSLQKSGSESVITSIVFNGAAKKIQFQYADSSSGNSTVRDGTIPFEFKDGEWYRIRVSIKATGSSGTSQRKAEININGKNVLKSSYFSSTKTGNTDYYDNFNIKMPKGSAQAANAKVYIDNFSVYKFNEASAAAGIGGIIDGGAVLSAIRDTEDMLDEVTVGNGAGEYSQARVAAVQTAVANGCTAYESADKTSDTLKAAVDAIELALKKFMTNENIFIISEPKFQYNYTDSEGKTSRKTMTALSDSDTMYTITDIVSAVDLPQEGQSVTVLVAAYDVANNQLYGISKSDGTIYPDSTLQVENTNDLKALTGDRTQYYVRVYVWDTTGQMVPLRHCEDNYYTTAQ